VVIKFRDKIHSLDGEIKAILKQEEEEKQLRLSEMSISKARNLVEHESEILSRPARTWIQEGVRGKRGLGKDVPQPSSKKLKKEAVKKKTFKKAETVSLIRPARHLMLGLLDICDWI
jgi:ATP-dependent RNA helicase DDX27